MPTCPSSAGTTACERVSLDRGCCRGLGQGGAGTDILVAPCIRQHASLQQGLHHGRSVSTLKGCGWIGGWVGDGELMVWIGEGMGGEEGVVLGLI